MLHNFLTTNRSELIDRCRQKVARRTPPPDGHSDHQAELDHGIPQFLDQLTDTLLADKRANRAKSLKISGPPEGGLASTTSEIAVTAGKHGHELLERGFSLGQVVHDYGDLCQAVTELAAEKHTSISPKDFRTFNRCLDNAIAQAVTVYVGQWGTPHTRASADASPDKPSESLGDELLALLNSIEVTFDMIKRGAVGLGGPTAAALESNLTAMRHLLDRSLVEKDPQAAPPTATH